jgi:hypothetical protein
MRYTEQNGQTNAYTAPINAKGTSLSESMTDDNSAARGFKILDHSKASAVPSPTYYWMYRSGIAPNRIYDETYAITAAKAVSTAPVVTTTISQSDAVRQMILGNLTDSVLAPVFVAELPEMKSLHKTLRDKGFGAKNFANRHLAWKFGVLPFISDLKKLANGYSTIAKHNEFINKNYMRIIKASVVNGTVSGSVPYFLPTGIGMGITQTVPWAGSSRAHVRLKVVRRYSAQDIINQTLDYYGASVSAYLYERTPYSFLVDWFFDVGGLINHLSPKFQQPCCQILDGGTVQRMSVSIPDLVWDDRNNVLVSVGVNVVTRCVRTSEPILPSSILGSGLDWAKTGIAASLLVQKVL